jgi:acyl-CoA thioesterase-1
MVSRRNLLSLLFLSSCLPGTPGALFAQQAASPGRRRRLVILGDSITAGFGLERSQAYPAVLQRRLDSGGWNFEVVGAGVSGDTSAGGLRRVAWALGSGADVFIVALGGNDGLRGLPPSETEANLKGILDAVKAKCPNAVCIVAGMQMPPNLGADYVRAFNAVFPRVAAERHALLVPFLLEGVGGVEKLNQADLIHPTAEGQLRVAENVWKVLEAALPKPGV